MLTMTGTCCVLMLVTSSCSKAPVLQTKRSALTANQCAPGTIARRMHAARESILWCRRGDGVDEVNVVGRYNDGRPKVAFALRNGKPHGTYRAWHRNGRRAIRQQYEDGELVGERTVWPNIGPSTRCIVDECAQLHAVLGRDFCDPDHISGVIESAQELLASCMSKSQVAGRTELVWWINMQGRPYAMNVSFATHVEVAQCIADVVRTLQFPLPFGETCQVTLPFTYEARAIK